MRTSRTSILAALAVGALLAGAPLALVADDVYLKNGRTFEGVVAEEGETQVRIEMPGGSLSLPNSAVLRVEKSGTTLGAYLQRKQDLQAEEARAHGERHAAEWLDLARWAKRNGLTSGAREAALTAASIDPHMPDLAPILRPLGYVYDEKTERWETYDESMRMSGFVQHGGQWMTPEQAFAEQAAERQAYMQQVQAAAAAQAQAQAAGAYDPMAQMAQMAQMALAQQAAAAGGYYDPNAYAGDGWPVLGYGGAAVGYGYGHWTKGTRYPGYPGRSGPPFRQPGSLPVVGSRNSFGGGLHAGGHAHR